jgi:hypothetical protein
MYLYIGEIKPMGENESWYRNSEAAFRTIFRISTVSVFKEASRNYFGETLWPYTEITVLILKALKIFICYPIPLYH